MNIDAFFESLNSITPVSRETVKIVNTYAMLLKKWNEHINLISNVSVEDIWKRHILDSAQLLTFIKEPTSTTLTDLGSGAGFPGIILSLLGVGEVHLVESDKKKCAFLQEASLLSPHSVIIHNNRIENLTPWEGDVLTARALAPLEKLLPLSYKFIKKNKITLFLKGQNVVEEINKITTYWDIQYKLHSSLDYSDGNILDIQYISKRA